MTPTSAWDALTLRSALLTGSLLSWPRIGDCRQGRLTALKIGYQMKDNSNLCVHLRKVFSIFSIEAAIEKETDGQLQQIRQAVLAI